MKTESDINYRRPVIVHYRGDDLPAVLTVSRRRNGQFWTGRVYVRPDLYKTVDQSATPINGGFGHLNDEWFLEHVRTVFGFGFGVEFDFLPEEALR
jgi:hypothetical protein